MNLGALMIVSDGTSRVRLPAPPNALTATHWQATGRPATLSIFDVATVDEIVESATELASGSRYVCRQLAPGHLLPPDAPYLLLYRLSLRPEDEHEVNAWYTDEHLPELAAVPGVLCARRFAAVNADRRHTYLATYHLAAGDVLTSPAWQAAATSDRTSAMVARMLDARATLFAVAEPQPPSGQE